MGRYKEEECIRDREGKCIAQALMQPKPDLQALKNRYFDLQMGIRDTEAQIGIYQEILDKAVSQATDQPKKVLKAVMAQRPKLKDFLIVAPTNLVALQESYENVSKDIKDRRLHKAVSEARAVAEAEHLTEVRGIRSGESVIAQLNEQIISIEKQTGVVRKPQIRADLVRMELL